MDETVEDYLRMCEEIDQGPHEVTKWEADFLDDLLERQPTRLSVKQMEVIERMAAKYLEGRGDL